MTSITIMHACTQTYTHIFKTQLLQLAWKKLDVNYLSMQMLTQH